MLNIFEFLERERKQQLPHGMVDLSKAPVMPKPLPKPPPPAPADIARGFRERDVISPADMARAFRQAEALAPKPVPADMWQVSRPAQHKGPETPAPGIAPATDMWETSQPIQHKEPVPQVTPEQRIQLEKVLKNEDDPLRKHILKQAPSEWQKAFGAFTRSGRILAENAFLALNLGVKPEVLYGEKGILGKGPVEPVTIPEKISAGAGRILGSLPWFKLPLVSVAKGIPLQQAGMLPLSKVALAGLGPQTAAPAIAQAAKAGAGAIGTLASLEAITQKMTPGEAVKHIGLSTAAGALFAGGITAAKIGISRLPYTETGRYVQREYLRTKGYNQLGEDLGFTEDRATGVWAKYDKTGKLSNVVIEARTTENTKALRAFDQLLKTYPDYAKGLGTAEEAAKAAGEVKALLPMARLQLASPAGMLPAAPATPTPPPTTPSPVIHLGPGVPPEGVAPVGEVKPPAAGEITPSGEGEPATPPAKEPWEMTKEEFSKTPGIVYHGSWRPFKGIDPTKRIYVTPSSDFASTFIRPQTGGELLPGTIKKGAKILDTRTPEGMKVAKEIIKADDALSYYGVDRYIEEHFKDGLPMFAQDKFADIVKNMGYDGLIVSEREGVHSYRLFNPNVLDLHKLHVQQALAEGKPVPEEVLAEYPDLKPTEPEKKAEELWEKGYDFASGMGTPDHALLENPHLLAGIEAARETERIGLDNYKKLMKPIWRVYFSQGDRPVDEKGELIDFKEYVTDAILSNARDNKPLPQGIYRVSKAKAQEIANKTGHAVIFVDPADHQGIPASEYKKGNKYALELPWVINKYKNIDLTMKSTILSDLKRGDIFVPKEYSGLAAEEQAAPNTYEKWLKMQAETKPKPTEAKEPATVDEFVARLDALHNPDVKGRNVLVVGNIRLDRYDPETVSLLQHLGVLETGVRLGDAEETGIMRYLLAKGDITQEEWDAFVNNLRQEGKIKGVAPQKSEAIKERKPEPEKPEIITRNRGKATYGELAADYKARGMDKYRAWDQLIIDKGLKPGIDAKEFYSIYTSVSPKLFRDVEVKGEITPTHILIETHSDTPREIQVIEETDEFVRFVTKNGSTGSTPRKHIKSLEPIKETTPEPETPEAEPPPVPETTWDEYTEKHFQNWLENAIYGYPPEEAEAIEAGIRQYVAENPDVLDRLSWPEIRDRAQADGYMERESEKTKPPETTPEPEPPEVEPEKEPDTIAGAKNYLKEQQPKHVPKFTGKKKDLVIHKVTLPKKTPLGILKGNVGVKGGVMFSTNLDVTAFSKTDLPDGVYTLVGKEAGLRAVKTEAYDVEDYPSPVIATGKKGKTTINLKDLQTALGKALAYVSKDEANALFQNVLLEVKGSKATLIASDTYRLAIGTFPIEGVEDGRYLLPRQLLEVLQKDKAVGDVFLWLDDEKISIDTGKWVVTARLREGKYPDFINAVPEKIDQSHVFSKAVLAGRVKELLDMKPAGDVYGATFIKTDKGFDVKIMSKVTGKEYTVPIPAEARGGGAVSDPGNIDMILAIRYKAEIEEKMKLPERENYFAINLKYLQDMLKNMPGKNVYMGWTDAVNPFLFSEEEIALSGKVKEKGTKGGPETRAFAGQAQKLAYKKGNVIEPVKRRDIINFLSEKLDIPIRVGRFRQRALGIFKVKPEVIRTKLANDIPVISHEVGHYLDKKFGLSDKAYDAELLKLGAATSRSSYTRKQKRAEGVAEFMRLYLTTDAEAQRQAPMYYTAFEETMIANPDIQDILLQAKKDIKAWIEQPAKARVLGSISIGEKKARKMSLDRLYTAIVDELRPIEKFVKEVAGEVDIEKNPFLIAWLGRGWIGKAETYLYHGVVDENFNKIGPSLQEILKPVSKKLDDFRAYIVSKRAVELHGRGKATGIEHDDAETVIKELETPEFKEALKKLVEYQDALLNELVESGIIDKTAAVVMRQLNQSYVPFSRIFEEELGASYGFGKSKYANIISPIRRLKGSERDIVDPLETIIKNTFFFINIAERNRVGRAIVELAEEKEGAGKWVEKLPPPVHKVTINLEEIKDVLEAVGVDTTNIDLTSIASVFRPSLFPAGKENILTVFRNGKKTFYQLEPELYRATLALDKESSNLFINLLSLPAKTLRAGATLTPEFMARNPIRDIQQAMIMSKYGFNPTDFAKGLFHALKKDDVFWKWQASGAAHGAMVSLDRDYLQGALKELLTEGVKDKTLNVLKNPIEVLRALSEFGEQATRIGVFAKGLKYEPQTRAGIMHASLSSRDSTIDFSRLGYAGKIPNRVIAFFNANVQDLDKIGRAFKTNPARTLMRCLLYITLPSMFMYFLNRNDKRYQELPQWQKDLFWIIPTKKRLYRIPKPFVLGVLFGTFPERVLQYIDTQDPKAFDEYASSLANVALPELIPTALLGWVEVYSNKWFFTGKPIVPRSEETLEPELQYAPYTTETAKLAGRALNVSPRKVEHLLRSYGGGLATHGTKILDVLINAATKEEKPAMPTPASADYPLIGAFVPRIWSSSDSIDKFYNELDAAERAYKSAQKKGNVLTKEEKQKLSYYRSIAKDLSRIRKATQEIYADKTLSAKQKKEVLDVLNIVKINMARKAIGKEEIEIKERVY